MKFISLAKKNPRSFFFFLFMLAWGSVAFSLWATEEYKLNPCTLCMFQRFLYLVIGGLALLGVIFVTSRTLWGWLIVLVSLGGMTTAIYQSWLQFNPEKSNCLNPVNRDLIDQFVDWLGARWDWLFFATGDCASIEKDFLSLSFANWSVLGFLFFTLAAILMIRR